MLERQKECFQEERRHAMKQLFEAVVKYFEEEHWKYLWVEQAGETRLFTQVQRNHDDFLCMSRVREENNEFVCSIYYDMTVPESKRQQVAAFFAQVNAGLLPGHFELDMQEGQMCFTTGMAGTDHPLTSAEVKQVVQSGLATAEHALPGLMALIGQEEPALAGAR
jgi:hypothetical protein